jgi:hypothetical protein
MNIYRTYVCTETPHLEKAIYDRIYMIYMKYNMVAVIPALLGFGLTAATATNQALAWGYWNGGGDGGGGYENNYLQSYYPQQPGLGAFANGYNAGISDAVYDHDNSLNYNPVGQCLPCHSEVYWNGFHHGYDTQWNTYQSTQQTIPISIPSPKFLTMA